MLREFVIEYLNRQPGASVLRGDPYPPSYHHALALNQEEEPLSPISASSAGAGFYDGPKIYPTAAPASALGLASYNQQRPGTAPAGRGLNCTPFNEISISPTALGGPNHALKKGSMTSSSSEVHEQMRRCFSHSAVPSATTRVRGKIRPPGAASSKEIRGMPKTGIPGYRRGRPAPTKCWS